MNLIKRTLTLLSFVVAISTLDSCTDLDQDVYSAVAEDNFWQTEQEIQSGIAPGYESLTRLFTYRFVNLQSTSDEFILPTRGGDFYEGGVYRDLWKHDWDENNDYINISWDDIYEGIGRINLSLSIIDDFEEKSEEVKRAEAEIEVLRDYYYFLLIDNFGNVPLVTDFNTPVDSVENSSREEVFDYVVKNIKENLPKLSESTGLDTYGKINKWSGLFILAKLYLNAEVYAGDPRWEEAMAMTDSIIESGQYSLNNNYFDNFSAEGGKDSPENIFAIPFDEENIGGNNFARYTLHGDNTPSFGYIGNGYNGRSAPPEFYDLFDTTSVYHSDGDKAYRTYEDQRTGQWLVGQQFDEPYPYPPDQNILVEGPDSLKLTDNVTGLDLAYQPHFDQFSSSEGSFRLAGARSVKYYPEAGVSSANMNNDIVLFRYADVLLMKAELEARIGNKAGAVDYVNQIRERAYGDTDHDFNASDLDLEKILDERGRELAWEFWRRQDLIRFEVADGKPYFTGPRKPEKGMDPDDHYMLFPIPDKAMRNNPRLIQNPGY